MRQRYKPPANFRLTASRTPSPEPIEIVGGLALLAEAPADPTNPSYPMSVVVNGTPRTRVLGTPGAGEYRVMAQSVLGADGRQYAEYLAVLEFHASDDGQTGTADYWRAGTVLTGEWYAALIEFLTPMYGVTPADLPAATTDVTRRGRPGDVAYLTDGSIVWSDGYQWNDAGTIPANRGSIFSAHQIHAAIDGAYVPPPPIEVDFSAAHGVASAIDASYLAPGNVSGDYTAAHAIAAAIDAAYAQLDQSGGYTAARTLGMSADGSYAAPGVVSGDYSASRTIGATIDGSYSAPGGGSASDDFNRGAGTLGANWSTISGLNAPQITASNVVNTASAPGGARYTATTYTSNQFSSIEYLGGAANTVGTGPAVRVQSGATTFYWAEVAPYDDGEGYFGYTLKLYRCVNGTYTQIGSTYDATMVDPIGLNFRIEANGTSIVVKQGANTRISTTDSNISGGQPGFVLRNTSDTLDDWSGGDL